MQFKDYYETLGVEPGAGEAEIKTAYRRMARKYHPDVSKEAGAEEKFKAVNEAYEALRDPQKRAAYDQLRARGYRPGDEMPPPGGGFGGGYGGQGGQKGPVDHALRPHRDDIAVLEDVAVQGDQVWNRLAADLGAQGRQNLGAALIGRMQVGHGQHATDNRGGPITGQRGRCADQRQGGGACKKTTARRSGEGHGASPAASRAAIIKGRAQPICFACPAAAHNAATRSEPYRTPVYSALWLCRERFMRGDASGLETAWLRA